LEQLYLDSTSVEDITPLLELKNLTVLDLLDTPVKSISPLSRLKSLNELYLPRQTTNEAQVEELRALLPHCFILRS